MTDERNFHAWNNFVMRCEPNDFLPGDIRRKAAIASLYMGLANNGGLNSFLTRSYELGGDEVVAALEGIGATIAARQLRYVLDRLGQPLLPTTEEARWADLEALWTESLDEFDVLTDEANRDLMDSLERHVQDHHQFYSSLSD